MIYVATIFVVAFVTCVDFKSHFSNCQLALAFSRAAVGKTAVIVEGKSVKKKLLAIFDF